ncbi:MAG TPA: serine/threonine phosphatase [Elainellaceae cyanobacterium]|jgi:protein phosphatase
MLVCPHCQFENPSDHKFCQKCGTSLHQAKSYGTESDNDIDRQIDVDKSSSQVIWQAVLSSTYRRLDSKPFQPTEAASRSLSSASETSSLQSDLSDLLEGKCLDINRRYQLLEPLPDLTASPAKADVDVEVRVLDRHPFEPSRLEAFIETRLDHPDDEIDSNVELNELSESLPAIAHTYLSLQHQLYPSLPQIHDAWEQNGAVIVLLEDRDALPIFSNILNENILPIQVVHWLYDMTELWGALKRYHCRQSLLELTNLRIDEDQILCLRRLYIDNRDDDVKLKDLGYLWTTILQRSEWSQSDEIIQVSQELECGSISTLTDLRSRLEIIADQLQLDEQSSFVNSELLDDFSGYSGVDDSDSEDTIPMDKINPQRSINTPERDQLDLADADSEFSDAFRSDDSGLPDTHEDIAGDGDDVPTVVLPMQLFSLTDTGRTDIGRQREHNEDCFSIHTEIRKQENPVGRILKAKGLYILCDGMGGHEGGEVASALAVETLKSYFKTRWTDQIPTDDMIREAIYLANQKIYELNQANACHGSGRMGTTLVMLLVQDTKAAIAHVGDSRLYQLTRKRGLEQMTVDHEVGQREISRGVEPAVAYARPDAYQLTQALGPRDETFINPDIQFVDISEDTLFVLCSDGLTDNDALENHSTEYLDPMLSSQANLDESINHLIELANHHNGHDNITIILARVKLKPYIESLRQG